MVTSYFFLNFTKVRAGENFANKLIKYDAALVSALLGSATTSLLTLRLGSAVYGYSAGSPIVRRSAAAGAVPQLTLVYLQFFLKKFFIIAQLLQRRSNFASNSRLSRNLVFAATQILLDVFNVATQKLVICFKLPTSGADITPLNAAAFWHRTPAVLFNISKKLSRFVFFLFSMHMIAPHQATQHTNTLRQGVIYLPELVLFLLLFASISVDSTGLPAPRILLV